MKVITTTNELKDFISEVEKSKFVTIDTEFMRETTFWPQLCLIQMATEHCSAIVDPLASDIALRPFYELMNNHRVLKVFHAARQDIEIIHHLSGIIPHPLFDSQIAAMVCGFGDSISYDQLVFRLTGKQIDKSSRYTNWAQRPLSESQLNYALADVTHLCDVYNALKKQLDSSGRGAWLEEELTILGSPRTYEIPPEDAWKRVKGRIRKPIELAVLQKIASWREREARKLDVPRGRLLKDESLIEIAIQRPTSKVKLAQLRSLQRGFDRSSQAESLLLAVEEALSLPKSELPKIEKNPTLPSGAAAAMDLIKVLMKIIADESQVATKLLANSDDIEKIVLYKGDANVPAMRGWRFELFGKKALDLLNGELCIIFKDNKIEVIPINNN